MSGLLAAGALAASWQRELAAHARWLEAGAPPPAALLHPAWASRLSPLPLSLESLGPAPSSMCFERLELHARRVLAANERLNLVSRREPERQILINLLDSLPFVGAWADVSRETSPEDEPPRLLIDAGSGSGVPGLPLHLVLADRGVAVPDLLLVESRSNKADFLDETLEALALDRAGVWGGRLEDPSLPDWLEEEGWNGPACLLARALGSVRDTLAWCRPLLGGEWLSDALHLKGGEGLLREWEADGRAWTRDGWQVARLLLFMGSERLLCFLRSSRR
ncbi:hypothetical protein FJ251_03725 [bacterium]|nr:hypothetical protein [bacterium]